MDSGNSGSISTSGDEEYDSRAHQTVLPAATFLNSHSSAQFGSISHLQSSLVSSHHQTYHPSLFDLSSSYLHTLSQSQPNSINPNPNSFLNLETGTSQGQRSGANCTDPASLQGVSYSSAPEGIINQSFLASQAPGQCTATGTDPSLQLRSVHDDNARVPSAAPTNAVRNSKKRTRASRRAPTTVLTTDTTNFRSMVQEFTGIPAPPFSSSSYSRRLDLRSGSSSLRSSASHLETTGAFYPLRPSPQKVHPNPLLLSSSSPSPSTLLHNSNTVDAITSTTNISSSVTANNPSPNNSFNSYQLLPDLGLPYHHSQNMMLSMQNHPIFAFHPPPPLHPLHNTTLPAGFSAKSQASLSMPSLEDMGMSHGQVNAHLAPGGVSAPVPPGHEHVASEGMPLRSGSDDGCRYGSTVRGPGGGGRRDPLRSLDVSYGKVTSAGSSCKLNFSPSASSSLNHEKTLDNTCTRGEGAVDHSWICSSD